MKARVLTAFILIAMAGPALAAPCPVFDRTMADIEKTLDIREGKTNG